MWLSLGWSVRTRLFKVLKVADLCSKATRFTDCEVCAESRLVFPSAGIESQLRWIEQTLDRTQDGADYGRPLFLADLWHWTWTGWPCLLRSTSSLLHFKKKSPLGRLLYFISVSSGCPVTSAAMVASGSSLVWELFFIFCSLMLTYSFLTFLLARCTCICTSFAGHTVLLCQRQSSSHFCHIGASRLQDCRPAGVKHISTVPHPVLTSVTTLVLSVWEGNKVISELSPRQKLSETCHIKPSSFCVCFFFFLDIIDFL